MVYCWQNQVFVDLHAYQSCTNYRDIIWKRVELSRQTKSHTKKVKIEFPFLVQIKDASNDKNPSLEEVQLLKK